MHLHRIWFSLKRHVLYYHTLKVNVLVSCSQVQFKIEILNTWHDAQDPRNVARACCYQCSTWQWVEGSCAICANRTALLTLNGSGGLVCSTQKHSLIRPVYFKIHSCKCRMLQPLCQTPKGWFAMGAVRSTHRF